MKKTLAAAAATVLSIFVGSVASASTITGNFSINGIDLFTTSSVTFVGTANVGIDSGDFTVLAPCIGCVVMNVGTLSTATPLPALIYTATNGAVSSFTLSPGATFNFTPAGTFVPGVGFTLEDALVISGTGIVTLTGKDPTNAIWALTAQGIAGGLGTFTFSATLISPSQVPLPAALPLFATGVIGLLALARKRNKPNSQSAMA